VCRGRIRGTKATMKRYRAVSSRYAISRDSEGTPREIWRYLDDADELQPAFCWLRFKDGAPPRAQGRGTGAMDQQRRMIALWGRTLATAHPPDFVYWSLMIAGDTSFAICVASEEPERMRGGFIPDDPPLRETESCRGQSLHSVHHSDC
jgi:hypothetical protein